MVWTNIIASLTSGEGKASPEVLKEKNKDGEVSRNKKTMNLSHSVPDQLHALFQ